MNQQPLNLKYAATQRGFIRADFFDLYDHPCHIQESSLADDEAIWLGANEGTHYEDTTAIDLAGRGLTCAAAMHLNRQQAAELITALQFFVDTGHLPEAEKS